jgi:large subunit ribosomal protein L7/L12
MGIFGQSSRGQSSAQDQVDLAHVNERLDRLESALASLQGQVAALTTGAVAAGGPPNALAGTDPGAVPYGNNIDASGPWLEEVRALKNKGNLIQAIKVYREHTNVGLKEAKDTVEGMI